MGECFSLGIAKNPQSSEDNDSHHAFFFSAIHVIAKLYYNWPFPVLRPSRLMRGGELADELLRVARLIAAWAGQSEHPGRTID